MKSYKDLYYKYIVDFKEKGLGQRLLLDCFQHALKADGYYLLMIDFKVKVKLFKYLKLKRTIKRVLGGYPLDYLRGYSLFYGVKVFVNHNTLIPRDETEELVDWVLKDNKEECLRVVDLCSGSGCIALAIKNKRNDYRVTGLDISKKANELANKSAKDLGFKDVEFIDSDLLENYHANFDIIVSNPPYIFYGDKEVSKQVKKYEPSLALFVDDRDGISMYRRIFEQLKNRKFKCGYFEIGYNQKEPLEKLLKSYTFKYEFRKDINGKDRMLKITK